MFVRGRNGLTLLALAVAACTAGSPTPPASVSVSIGAVADATNLVLEARSGYRRATRLDAGYLIDVVEGLLTQREYREGREKFDHFGSADFGG